MVAYLDYLWVNTGRCTICMRKAFKLAFASWLFALGAFVVAGHLLGMATGIFATGATTLWITHLIVYSGREAVNAQSIWEWPSTFIKRFKFIAVETAYLLRSPPKDRFGLPVAGRLILAELKNQDGTRTAFFKNQEDVKVLINELQRRGVTGEAVTFEYWMSTASCERSSTSSCRGNSCDKAGQSCSRTGTGNFDACRCS